MPGNVQSFVTLIILVLFGSLAGCGGHDEATIVQSGVRVVSFTNYSAVKAEDIPYRMSQQGAGELQLSTSLGGYDTVAAAALPGSPPPRSLIDLFIELYNAFKPSLRYLPVPVKVVYKLPGSDRELSGLLVYPYTFRKMPILSLQHPTQVERKYSPSFFRMTDNELTTQYAVLLASMGYIVVVADYPGLGVNTETHPYCLNTLADSVVGMIAASKKIEGVTRTDGRLFLMGYSEGGYATLVTARRIQEKLPGINLVAAAALDGPHSLSVTMHDVMLKAGKEYGAPYFLPYVIAGYGAGYPSVPEFRFGGAIVDEPAGFAAQLYRMLDGSYTGGEISGYIKGLPGYHGPSTALTEGFIRLLETDGSVVNAKLRENNAYAWTPNGKVMIRMWHNVKDDLVPVGNTENAAAAWKGIANLEATYFSEYIDGLGSVHAGALIPAYIKATSWLNGIAFPYGNGESE
jgi:pimeloyl-ACP methyl ester carboxylesterase